MNPRKVLYTILLALAVIIRAEAQSSKTQIKDWVYEAVPYIPNQYIEASRGKAYSAGNNIENSANERESILFTAQVKIQNINQLEALLIANGDWPIDVYINKKYVAKRGVYEDQYRSTLYSTKRIIVPPEYIINGTNEIRIQGYPLYEKTPLPIIKYGTLENITLEVFIRNILNIYLLQASVITAAILSIFFAAYYITTGKTDRKLLYIAMFCLFFIFGWSNQAIWNESLDSELVYKISRVGVMLTVLTLLVYAVENITKNKYRYVLIAIASMYTSVLIALVSMQNGKENVVNMFVENITKYYLTPMLLIIMAVFLINVIKKKNTQSVLILMAYIVIAIASTHDIGYIRASKLPYAWMVSYSYLILMVILFFTISTEHSQWLEKAVVKDELEIEVKERTDKLNKIITSTEMGIMVIDRNLVVLEGYSDICKVMFGKDIAGIRVDKVLFENNPEKQDELVEGLKIIIDKDINADAVLGIQDKIIEIKDKLYEINYGVMESKEILITMEEVTDQYKYDEILKSEMEKQNIMYRAIKNKEGIGYLAAEMSQIMQIGKKQVYTEKDVETVEEVEYDAIYYGFNKTAEYLKNMKELMQERITGLNKSEIDTNVIVEKYKYELSLIEQAIGKDWINEALNINIDKRKYLKILQYINNQSGGEDIVENIKDMARVSISKIIDDVIIVATEKIVELGKRVNNIKAIHNGVNIKEEMYPDLKEILIGILNNIIENSIEDSSERIALGKAREASIKIEVYESTEREQIRIVVIEDGRGVEYYDYYCDESIEECTKLNNYILGTSKEKYIEELNRIAFNISKMGGEHTLETISGFGTELVIILPTAGQVKAIKKSNQYYRESV